MVDKMDLESFVKECMCRKLTLKEMGFSFLGSVQNDATYLKPRKNMCIYGNNVWHGLVDTCCPSLV